MSLELKPVMVRLGEEAYETLALLAGIEDKDLGEKAREILTRALMGEGHAAKVMATRLARALKRGKKDNGAQSATMDLL